MGHRAYENLARLARRSLYRARLPQHQLCAGDARLPAGRPRRARWRERRELARLRGRDAARVAALAGCPPPPQAADARDDGAAHTRRVRRGGGGRRRRAVGTVRDRDIDTAMATVRLLNCALPCALAACADAHAHAAAPASRATDAAPLAWTFEPWVVIVLAASLLLYLAGYRRLRMRGAQGRAGRSARLAAFVAGWLALVVALVSPLHALSEWLFSAHMLQHEIFMLVAAPLLVIGRPLAIWLWAFPATARARIGAATRSRWIRRPWRWLTLPRSPGPCTPPRSGAGTRRASSRRRSPVPAFIRCSTRVSSRARCSSGGRYSAAPRTRRSATAHTRCSRSLRRWSIPARSAHSSRSRRASGIPPASRRRSRSVSTRFRISSSAVS
ncbi:membrane protein of unknown function (plasmid) [Caballeronia sp. S22]